MQEDVAAAEAQRERWERRTEAAASLDSVMEAVRTPGRAPSHAESPSTTQEVAVQPQGGTEQEFAARMTTLESAIDHARDAGISVSRAKRLLKDMQAQAAAGAAAARLREVLKTRPCGSGLLKVCACTCMGCVQVSRCTLCRRACMHATA